METGKIMIQSQIMIKKKYMGVSVGVLLVQDACANADATAEIVLL